jgi:hypothetical protein
MRPMGGNLRPRLGYESSEAAGLRTQVTFSARLSATQSDPTGGWNITAFAWPAMFPSLAEVCVR